MDLCACVNIAVAHATLQTGGTSGRLSAGSAHNRSIELSSCGRIDPAKNHWQLSPSVAKVSPKCRQVSPKCRQVSPKCRQSVAALRRASPNVPSVAKVSPSVAKCRQIIRAPNSLSSNSFLGILRFLQGLRGPARIPDLARFGAPISFPRWGRPSPWLRSGTRFFPPLKK